MNYLPLETSQLLEKVGCTNESGTYWVTYEHNSEYPDDGVTSRTFLHSEKEVKEKDSFDRDMYQRMERGKYIDDIVPAFTWDDICTKENAVKIWGENEFAAFQPYIKGLGDLLMMKLNGENWMDELLKYLNAI